MDRTNVIGEKVKSLRTAKEISLEELADRTGLAVEQITRIEENIDIPSLAPLVKLARALGVRLGTFLDDQPDEAGPVVCRRGDADDTISFSNNALDARQHLHYHSLSRSKTDRHMEPFIALQYYPSKCGCPQGHVGSNPTLSAIEKSSNHAGFWIFLFLRPLQKSSGFELFFP